MREVLLLGLRRAGKTSISRVVFGNMDPSQTQYLHATYAVTPTQVSVDALAKFTILDFPGQEDMVAKDIIGMQSQMRDCGALVFVLDCTDYSPSTGGGKRADYEEAIDRLVLVVQQMHIVAKPDEARIVDVFLHKADKLTSELQRGVQEEVRQQLQFRLKGRIPVEFETRRVIVQYHLTSIFDHSVFYAFSLVARRVIPNILHIQSLLQVCCNNSHVLSYFLFGISRRMFIASANVSDDRLASEREALEYECCSDIVDMFQSMHTFIEDGKRKLAYLNSAAINSSENTNSNNNNTGTAGEGTTTNNNILVNGKDNNNAVTSSSVANNNNINGNQQDSKEQSSSSSKKKADAPSTNALTNEKNKDDNANTNSTIDNIVSKTSKQVIVASAATPDDMSGELADATESAVFNFPSARPQDCIKPIYLVRKVGPLLTLVVGIKNENVDSMRSAIEYNIDLLEKALMQILSLNEEILRNSQ